MFKYDTHVHTSETSVCAKVMSRDVVRMYKDAGYSGIVITDHYHKRFFENSPGESWDDKITDYLKGYKNALDEGQKVGLTVLFGMELRFVNNINDYLVFGIDEDFLRETKELHKLDLMSFKKLIAGKRIMIYQAHPFREKMSRVDPRLLDGIEVYNGHPRHNSNNDLALEYAKKNNLKMLSGSDFHQVEDLARGGIIIENKINSIEDLVTILSEDKVVDMIKNL